MTRRIPGSTMERSEPLRPGAQTAVEAKAYPAVFCGGALVVEDARRRRGAMDFKLRVDLSSIEAPEGVVELLVGVRPTLAEHACTSDDIDGGEGPKGHSMTLPHLVEHLAIDLLVERRDPAGEGGPIAGYTVWLDRRRGLARVTLSSTDHVATEQALLDACRILDEAESGFRSI